MVWIIGASGMLGREIQDLCVENNVEFCASDLDVDILSTEALERYYEKYKPDVIINCAAYTAVDKAEDEPDLAFKINAEGVNNIALLAVNHDALLFHISTDYVFPGNHPSPLSEDHPTEPVSTYGRSKLAGEEAVIESGCRYFIIRTAWLYGKYGKSFVSTMLSLMNARDSLKVVKDQRGSPTWTKSLAEAILDIINSPKAYGIYHFSSNGDISWYDFSKKIYELGHQWKMIHHQCNIESCTSNQFPTKAKRPAYSLLNKDKIIHTFSVRVPSWEYELEEFFKSVQDNWSWD